MAKTEFDVADLMLKIMKRQTGEISKIDYVPQKKEFPDKTEYETHLERCTPEKIGISSDYIADLFTELSMSSDANMHKIMIVRNGNVIGETGFGYYKPEYWHVTHSMCKSVTGMAIGLLVDEGKLSIEDKLSDIFSSKKSIFDFLRMKETGLSSLKVKDLLTMSSGIPFNESGAITAGDWRQSFLQSNTQFEPGSQFEYNSMNSYMLSAIVSEITGMSMFDFLVPRIFKPLGIERVLWESDSQGITKGGWGLFLRIEDMAKLGMLYLQEGEWNGKQLISKEWVKESVTTQIDTGEVSTDNYGYQIWTGQTREGEFTYNGMLGQNVFCYPDINMVVCTNAGNNCVFQDGDMTAIICKYMKDIEVSGHESIDNPRALNRLRYAARRISCRTTQLPIITQGGWQRRRENVSLGSSFGRKKLINLSYKNKLNGSSFYLNKRTGNQYIKLWTDKITGAEYELDQKGIGVFPLIMQVFHNNFTDGMKSISFVKNSDNSLDMVIKEGDATYTLRCNLGNNPIYSSIDMHGEIYTAAVKTSFATDEQGRFAILNEILYIEEAATRTINVFFDNTGAGKTAPSQIEIHMDEKPGSDMIVSSLKGITPESWIESLLMGRLEKNGIMDTLGASIAATVKPRLVGNLIQKNEA